MVRGMMMNDAQIEELVRLARQDPQLWADLKDRELEGEKLQAQAARQGKWVDDEDVVLDPIQIPSMPMLVSDLVKQYYGSNENYVHISLIVAIRHQIRIELGLPV